MPRFGSDFQKREGLRTAWKRKRTKSGFFLQLAKLTAVMEMTESFAAQNIGPLDRVSRGVLGFILIGARYFFRIDGVIGDLLVLLGAFSIWEGLLGYCLLYGVLDWSTKRR